MPPINYLAYIVLLPKVQIPKEPKDFWPITLVHSFDKLLSKLLANRLAPHLADLVGSNQSAFIQRRSILDYYKYVQRAAALLRKRKNPKLLLKLDISKAFDAVAWPFLLEVLQVRGFGRKWTDWISALLSTASSKVFAEWKARAANYSPSGSETRRPAIPNAIHHCYGRP